MRLSNLQARLLLGCSLYDKNHNLMCWLIQQLSYLFAYIPSLSIFWLAYRQMADSSLTSCRNTHVQRVYVKRQ